MVASKSHGTGAQKRPSRRFTGCGFSSFTALGPNCASLARASRLVSPDAAEVTIGDVAFRSGMLFALLKIAASRHAQCYVSEDIMRTLIRRVLNLLLYLSFCMMTGTGLLMAFRLIPGNRGGRGLTVLGWTRHEWGDLHTWVAYAFIALIVLHMLINWAWLTKVAGNGRLWPLLIGLAAGILIIAAFLILPIKEQGRGRGRGFHASIPTPVTAYSLEREPTILLR